MKLAINLANNQKSLTGQNPSVGCIVEKNGAVISSGHTSLNGRPHAEFNALNKKSKGYLWSFFIYNLYL